MRKTRIVRTDLLQTLARVEPGRSAKNFIEQSSCYVLDRGWVCTFNDEVCCKTRNPQLDAEFVGAVHGQPLIKVLENLTDDEVYLEVVGSEFRVNGRRKKSGIRLEAEVVLPVAEVETPPADAWASIDSPDEFAEAIRHACAAAGTDQEEAMAVCVHVTPSGVEATDRNVAARYEVVTGLDRDCLVKAKSLQPVAALGVTKIAATDNWLHFRNKGLFYSVRRQLDEYPNLQTLWEFTATKAELPRGAKEAAKLGGIFSSEDKENDRVIVHLSEGKMRVRGEGAHGWAEADLDMAYHGPSIKFRIPPLLLQNLVEKHNSCEIGANKLIVRGERWQFVTALAPVEESATPQAEAPVEYAAEEETADAF